jgi:hypothetical protein
MEAFAVIDRSDRRPHPFPPLCCPPGRSRWTGPVVRFVLLMFQIGTDRSWAFSAPSRRA